MNNSTSRAIQQAISYQFQSLGIVCPVPAGTWNATTSYRKLNIVRTAHASYIAKQASLNIEPGVTSGWEDYWQLNASDGTGGGEAFYPDQIYSQLGAGLDGDGNVITATYATKTENDAKVTSTILQNVVYIHNATQDSTMPFSATPTASSIVSRDQNGDFTVNAPSADANPATKAYVDSTDESLQADITEAQSDIAALQTASTDLSQSVDDIYTILQQEVYNSQDIEQEYSSRETADGADIIDGALETVKKIQGATVKTTNLLNVTKTIFETNNKVTYNPETYTFTITEGTVGISESAYHFDIPIPAGTKVSTYIEFSQGQYTDEDFSVGGYNVDEVNGSSWQGQITIPPNQDLSGRHFSTAFTTTKPVTDFWLFVNAGTNVTTDCVFRIVFNIGDTVDKFIPYFPGLKNAYFQGLRSTGRNLIPFPYNGEVNAAGATFTVNDDGSITVNKPTANGRVSSYYLAKAPSINFVAGKTYTISGGSGNAVVSISYTDDGTTKYFVSETSAVNFTWNENYIFISAYVHIYANNAVNNVTVYPMLNYGSSAFPYEPYVSHEISLDTAIELPAWDSINPTTGKKIVQSNTTTFDGTEAWHHTDESETHNYFKKDLMNLGGLAKSAGIICNRISTSFFSDMYIQITGLTDSGYTTLLIATSRTVYPELTTTAALQQLLSEWATAGDPLTVCYQTATATESDISMEDRLPAYKNGSETVIQGATDNSEYGAENTLTQNYAEVKGTTGTTEGGNS